MLVESQDVVSSVDATLVKLAKRGLKIILANPGIRGDDYYRLLAQSPEGIKSNLDKRLGATDILLGQLTPTGSVSINDHGPGKREGLRGAIKRTVEGWGDEDITFSPMK